jgi:PAS domain S-box-containing protein
MSWITVIWAMVVSACITLAVMHLLIWCRRRDAWGHAIFSVLAVATVFLAACEVWMMRTETAEEAGMALRWGHVPFWVLTLSLVGFVRLHLRAGRPWLAWAVCGVRTLSLILNFVFSPNLNYREITALRHIHFFGETISVTEGVANPWMLVGQASLLLLVVFVADATLTVWRRGDRRQALLLGGAIVFFAAAATGQIVLVLWGVVPTPFTISLFFLGIVVAMNFELSDEVFRAARLSDHLRESEARLRDITFSAADWVWEVDENGVYTYSSPKGVELLGNVIGKTPFDFMPPDEAERVAKVFSGITANKAPIRNLENWNIRPNGDRICLLTNGVPILDQKGNLKGYRGVDKDITERKRAEKALQESEARYRGIFDGALEGISRTTLQGTILVANPALAKMLGYDSAEDVVRGVVDSALQVWADPAERSRLAQLLEEQGSVRGYECRFLRKDGTEIWVSLSSRAFRGPDGQTAYYDGFIEDITDRRQNEESLRAAYVEIQALKERLEAENLYLRSEIRTVAGYEEIIGQSEAIRQVVGQAEQVAPTDSTVLIQGQTGTGKELLAHVIHMRSPRNGKPFVTVNLASLPSSLLEGELFGREKGAYTGAMTRQTGRFEVADGGTIFLDEIGEMPLETQAKLLRVLQQGEFERLGSTLTFKVNVRIIAATNRDLASEVRNGQFREDLFYRLNVFPIRMPPLSERREDIPLLAWSFVKEFGERMGKRIERISRRSMETLQAYSWPGNVRELRNVMERSIILTSGVDLQLAMPETPADAPATFLTLADADRQHILGVLKMTDWRVSGKGGAAERLGLKPSTLESKMKRLGIRRAP